MVELRQVHEDALVVARDVARGVLVVLVAIEQTLRSANFGTLLAWLPQQRTRPEHLRRLQGTEPAQEQRWLELVSSGLARRWGGSPAQIEATLLLYLLTVNARYADERAEAPDAPARQGWTRSLVQELNHG